MTLPAPKVSVFMITYNHEPYIAQAIDSVLMQQANFDVELVIGEDCSKDATRQIVLDYQRRYPKKIRAIISDSNVGSQRNCMRTLAACTGQYIALLEGDDYWTCPDKLQMQADYLDSHPNCATSFHDVANLSADGRQWPKVWDPALRKPISTLVDLLAYSFIPTCSTMWRNGPVRQLPEGFETQFISDWILQILHAQHGDIGFIDKTMAVYRNHSGGIWSSQSEIKQQESMLKTYPYIDTLLDYRYHREIRALIYRHYVELAINYERAGEIALAKAYAKKSLLRYPINPYLRASYLFGLLRRLYAPRWLQRASAPPRVV